MVVCPAMVLNGRTSIGGAKPKVVEEKLVGVKPPPEEKASPVMAPGPSMPLVVALDCTVTRAVLARLSVSITLPDKSLGAFVPVESKEIYRSWPTALVKDTPLILTVFVTVSYEKVPHVKLTGVA